jgi:hypothetical protein
LAAQLVGAPRLASSGTRETVPSSAVCACSLGGYLRGSDRGAIARGKSRDLQLAEPQIRTQSKIEASSLSRRRHLKLGLELRHGGVECLFERVVVASGVVMERRQMPDAG